MRLRKSLLWLSPVLLLPLVPMAIEQHNARSVRPSYMPSESVGFNAAESVGFFVGVSRFTHDTSLTDVRYAADDAVDLAHAFAIAAKEPLVRPARVVIAISNDPRKKESKTRLKELADAGATVVKKVDQADLIKILQDQAALAGREGMFIVSFATHGFSEDGVPYLLGGSSFFSRSSTALSAAEMTEIVARSEARRSLIFVDACRERVTSDTRSGAPDSRSAAPFIEKIVRIEGQAVLYAAAPGGYAYDDETRGNGVFTAAVIDALDCEAGSKPATITVEQLATRVENQVRKYLRKRDPSIAKATQLSTEGSTREMPLMLCRAPWPPPPPPHEVASVRFNGTMLEAFDDRGTSLWKRTLRGTIIRAVVEPVFRGNTRYIVVLSDEGAASLLSIYDGAGDVVGTYAHDGPLRHVAVAKPSFRHNPRIVVAGSRRGSPTVAVLEPKKIAKGESWYGILGTRETITDLTIAGDHLERSIVVTMSRGKTVTLGFNGTLIDGDPGATPFTLIEP